eukprot:TRINITY_DN4359_c0_g1_i1.p1 TRINITY_DN4359_c0_g1~~TRINITY_DN4359_c0_g1_i1.p1  ORF type:complete len:393 (-),score=165.59 TRINITY_DN4359_c0_g1_i1:31-1209(-)
MHWATEPKRTNMYRLWVGDESSPSTTYTPGKLHKVFLRVTKHRMVYRGLLMYAEDSNGDRVGTWELPADEPQLFHVHDSCTNAVMHTSAEHKPYLVQFAWRAPDSDVGVIRFPALVKFGDANHGDFYWPNEDGTFELSAGAVPEPAAIQWVRSEVGASCTDACIKAGRVCQEDKFATLNSMTALDSAISDEHACKLPYLRGCHSAGPTSSVDSFCYYHDADKCDSALSSKLCDVKSASEANGRRFCPCRNLDIDETLPPTPGPTTTTTTAAAGATGGGVGTTSGPALYAPPETCKNAEGTVQCPCDGGKCHDESLECLQNSICVLRDCVGEEGCPCSKGRCLGKTLRCAFVDETAVDGVCEEKPVEMVDSATVQRVATLAIAVVLGTLLAMN